MRMQQHGANHSVTTGGTKTALGGKQLQQKSGIMRHTSIGDQKVVVGSNNVVLSGNMGGHSTATAKVPSSLRLQPGTLRLVDPQTRSAKVMHPLRKRSYSDHDIVSHNSEEDVQFLEMEGKRSITPPPGASPPSVGRDNTGLSLLESSQQNHEPVSWNKPKSLVLSKIGQSNPTNYLRERRARKQQEEQDNDSDDDDDSIDSSDIFGEWDQDMDSPMSDLITLDSVQREKMFVISRHITDLEETIREHEEQEGLKRRQDEWDTESEGEDNGTEMRQSRVILVKNEEE